MVSFAKSMTYDEITKLNIGDRVDFKCIGGKFVPATITRISKHIINIHLDSLPFSNAIPDLQVSATDTYKFYTLDTICNAQRNRLFHVIVGNYVDIYIDDNKQWIKGQIKAIDGVQVNVECSYMVGSNHVHCKRWFNLNNQREIDHHRKHTSNGLRNLGDILYIKRLFRSLSNTQKARVLNNIDTVYSDTDKFDILLDNSSKDQLQQISVIVKQQYLTSNIPSSRTNTSETNHDICNHNNNDEDSVSLDDPNEVQMISICDLGSDVIHYMITFLGRDIGNLKLCSFWLARVCMNRMTRLYIVISNINEVYTNNSDKYNDNLFKRWIKLCASNFVISPEARVSFVSDLCKNFNIMNRDLILTTSPTIDGFHTGHYDDIKSIKLRELTARTFCAYSKSNTIFYDHINDTFNIINNDTDLDTKYQKMQCIWTNWFHSASMFTVVSPIQPIFFRPNSLTWGRLLSYMENEFISTTPKQTQWRTQLLHNFQQMNTTPSTTSKITGYCESGARLIGFGPIGTRLPHCITCNAIFSFNSAHPAFATTAFPDINLKYTKIAS